MKAITIAGGTFSLKFRKWNRKLKKGGDLVNLKAVRIRQKAGDEKIENSSHKIFITDTTTGSPLNCWQCLIVEFNGKKINL